MLYIIEIPHQLPAACWTAIDRADFIRFVQASAAQNRSSCTIYSPSSVRQLAEEQDIETQDRDAMTAAGLATLAEKFGLDTPIFHGPDWGCSPEWTATDPGEFESCRQYLAEDQREDAAKVLQRLRELAGWFPRFRPVAIDPRAIIERAQASPGVLMGFGVTFSGGRFGTPSIGAIVDAEPCSGYELRLTIRTEDGAEHIAAPRDFTDSGNIPALFRFDGRQHGAPYLAQLAAAVASKRASETASKELAAQAFQRAKAELLAAHPDLVQPGDGMSHLKAAATNIRRMLKAAFPGVKFSVTSKSYTGGDSIRVRWTDGPCGSDVDAIVDQFSAGSFNGMDDSYTYRRTPWNELFGSAQYTFTERDYSDATIAEVIAQEWPNPDRRPTVADFRAGRMWQFEDSGSPTLWPALNRWTAPQFRPVSA